MTTRILPSQREFDLLVHQIKADMQISTDEAQRLAVEITAEIVREGITRDTTYPVVTGEEPPVRSVNRFAVAVAALAISLLANIVLLTLVVAR